MVRYDGQLLVASDPTEGHIYSFEALTGELNWKWPSGSGVSSDLLVVEERVFAVTLDNELVALDVKTGEKVWITEGTPDVRGIAPTSATPVTLDGDIVWAREDGRLSRRRLKTGTIVWTADLDVEVSTDLLVHSGKIILGVADGRLLRIDPADGQLLNETDVGDLPTYRWLPVGEDRIVGMTGVTGDGRQLVCVDAETLEVQWALPSPPDYQWTTSQPTIAWGLVLAGTSEMLLYAIDPQSGDVVWTADVEQSPRIVKVVDNRIYIGTFGGTLLAYRR